MSVKMSGPRQVFFMAAVILSNIAIMGEFIIYPVVDTMYGVYESQSALMDFYIMLPQLLTAVFSFAAPVVISRTSSKTTLILGGVLFSVGGILSIFSNNIWYLVLMRIPYGIGIAFCTVAAIAVISEVYTDEKKRSTMIGVYGAFQAAVGALLSFAAGIIAVSGWKKAYSLYFSGILMIILFAICVPQIRQQETQDSDQPNADGTPAMKKKEGFGLPFILMAAAFIMFCAAASVPNTYLSSSIMENGLGNEATAGVYEAIFTLSGFVLGLVFGFLYQKFRGKVILPWYALSAVGMLCMFFVPNLALLALWCFIIGGAMSLACAYTYAHITVLVPASRVDAAIGVLSASCCIGYAIGPYLVSGTMLVTGSDRFANVLITCAVIIAAAVVIELLNNFVLIPKRNLSENG